MTEARLGLFILHSYRTGSNILASLYEANGLGRPAEYFNGGWQKSTLWNQAEAQWRPGVIETIARNAVSGIFACKFPLQDFLCCLKGLGADHRQLGQLTALFEDCRFVLLQRRDLFGQAVSLWRAKETGRWWSYNDAPEPAPEYDYNGIYDAYVYLCRERSAWDEIVRVNAIEVETLFYEDFSPGLASLSRPIRSAAEWAHAKIGHPLREVQLTTENRLQRDVASDEFRQRFLDELMASYTSPP